MYAQSQPLPILTSFSIPGLGYTLLIAWVSLSLVLLEGKTLFLMNFWIPGALPRAWYACLAHAFWNKSISK